MGTTDIGAHWTVRFWDLDFESGGCTRYLETANPDAICDVAGIRGYVSNPPVSDDGDAVVAGQQFTLNVDIVKQNGEVVTSVNGDATLSIGGNAHSGETRPSGVSISSGSGSAQIKL